MKTGLRKSNGKTPKAGEVGEQAGRAQRLDHEVNGAMVVLRAKLREHDGEVSIFHVYKTPCRSQGNEPCTNHDFAQVLLEVRARKNATVRSCMHQCSGLDGESMGAEVAVKGDQTRVSHQGGGGVANNIEGSKATSMITEPAGLTAISGGRVEEKEAVAEEKGSI